MENNDEIDIKEFLEARAGEIKYLEEKIQKSTKKSLLHQRLPFHKRRRKRSENKRNRKISQKTKRKRDPPYLRTHIWFAKRFKMIKIFGSVLPHLRNEKSDKFIYKSFDRGFVFDESFKSVCIFLRKNNKRKVDEFKQDKCFKSFLLESINKIFGAEKHKFSINQDEKINEDICNEIINTESIDLSGQPIFNENLFISKLPYEKTTDLQEKISDTLNESKNTPKTISTLQNNHKLQHNNDSVKYIDKLVSSNNDSIFNNSENKSNLILDVNHSFLENTSFNSLASTTSCPGVFKKINRYLGDSESSRRLLDIETNESLHYFNYKTTNIEKDSGEIVTNNDFCLIEKEVDMKNYSCEEKIENDKEFKFEPIKSLDSTLNNKHMIKNLKTHENSSNSFFSNHFPDNSELQHEYIDLANDFIFDESKFLKNMFYTIRIKTSNNHIEFIDLCITESFVIIVTLPFIDLLKIFKDYIFLGSHDICLSMIEGSRNLLESGIYEGINKTEKSIDDYISELIKNVDLNDESFITPYCYIKSTNSFEKGKVFSSRKNLMKIWQLFVNKGIIPVSLNELFRISTEKQQFIYPIDCIFSQYFSIFDKTFYNSIEKKWLAKPIGKRGKLYLNFNENPFYLDLDFYKNKKTKIRFFQAERGNIKRLAKIFDENKKHLGYVLRSAFSFKKGKFIGVSIIQDIEDKQLLFAQNMNSQNLYTIEI